MHKRDAILLSTIIFIIGLLFAFRYVFTEPGSRSTVVIMVNGSEYARVPLSESQSVTVHQENGAVNTIDITQGGAVMRFATCPDQLCIHQGMVTSENYMIRPTQSFIICLPNRVSVELIPEAVNEHK